MPATATQTAIFASPYGGEERVTIRRARGGWSFKAPYFNAMTFGSAEAAKAKAERMHGFIRWA
jgi:hypothetical protein